MSISSRNEFYSNSDFSFETEFADPPIDNPGDINEDLFEALDNSIFLDELNADTAHDSMSLPSFEILADAEDVLDEIPENFTSENLNDFQDSSDIAEWLPDINPNFDEFDIESPYCNNCGSCAFAVYQRLEGNQDACATADNIDYNYQMSALTGMEQVSMSPEEIETKLLEAGDGAHAIIGIDRNEGPGHWFNAACINGKVVSIDGQTGDISPWPPDYGDVCNWEMSVRKE